MVVVEWLERGEVAADVRVVWVKRKEAEMMLPPNFRYMVFNYCI